MPSETRPPKIHWHALSLQQLDSKKFAKIVNDILTGRLLLFSGSKHKPKQPPGE